MYPKQHLILGVVFASLLFFLFPKVGIIGFFLISFSAVLIDVDHYLYYVYRKKDWSLKKAFHWHVTQGNKLLFLPREKRKNIFLGFFFLH